MKILIIGGNRYTGKLLAIELARLGHTVHCMNRSGDAPAGCTPIAYDRELGFDTFQFDGYDMVYDMCCYNPNHMRGIVPHMKQLDIPYVFISSAAVYDQQSKQTSILKTTDSPLVTNIDGFFGQYAFDKAMAEKVLVTSDHFKWAIIRPPYIYGENDPKQRLRGMIDAYKNSNFNELVGGGNPVSIIWDTVYVKKLTGLINIVLWPHVYNVSGEFVTSLQHLISLFHLHIKRTGNTPSNFDQFEFADLNTNFLIADNSDYLDSNRNLQTTTTSEIIKYISEYDN